MMQRAMADRIAVVGPTLGSLAAGLYVGSRAGYWYDELWSVDAVSGSFSRMLDLLHADFHPPGYHWLLWAWVRLFGASEVATHALSAICIAGVVYLTGRIAVRMGFPPLATFMATMLTAFSLAALRFAAETRASAWFTLLVLAALYFSAVTVWSRGRFAASLALGILAIYSHYAALLALVVAVTILAVARNEKRWAWLALAWPAALLPYAWLIHSQAARFKTVGWLQPPDWPKVYAALRSFAGSGYPLVCLAVLVAWIAVATLRRKPRQADAWLLIAPTVFVASIAASYLVLPIFHLRYLLPVLPWLALSAGYAATYAFPNRIPFTTLLLTGLVVTGAWEGRAELTTKSEDWRGAAGYVMRERPGLPIITTGVGRYFSHYLPQIIVLEADGATQLTQWLDQPENAEFWFVMARDFRMTEAAKLLQERTEILDSAIFEKAIAQRLKVRK